MLFALCSFADALQGKKLPCIGAILWGPGSWPVRAIPPNVLARADRVIK